MPTIYMPCRVAEETAENIAKIAKRGKLKKAWVQRYLLNEAIENLDFKEMMKSAKSDLTSQLREG